MKSKSIDELLDEGEPLVPMAMVLEGIDAARFRALAVCLLDEQGAREQACPVCGELVRVAAVVFTGQRTGERTRDRVVLNADNLAQHSGRCAEGARALKGKR